MSNRDYNIAHIRKYVAGKLSPKEMHELERAAHADEMLMDLIQGVELEQQQHVEFPKEELTARISARTFESKREPPYIWKQIAIAATVLMVFGFSFYFFRNQQQSEKTLATAERSKASSQDTLPHAITASKAARADSSSASDSLKDTRLALVLPQKNTPSPLEANESRRSDQEEQLENILADIATDSQKIAMVHAETATSTQELIANASTAQAKQSASAAGVPIRLRGISTVPSNDSSGSVVFGKIIDRSTEQPLAQVTVKDLLSDKTTTSDDKGNFVLFSNKDSVNLDISYIGYEGQRLASRTSGVKIIELEPAYNSLDEVVVAGLGKIEISTKSVPLTGWKDFNNYIAERAKATKLRDGTVTLKFDLDYTGQPIQILVDQSVDSLHDAAAIEILKNGPKWKLGKKSTGIKIKVKFR